MANFELYKIFITVAKEKTLIKASEKLNITQPAITKHIRNLENELNTTLFIRKKGMELTEKGQKLFDEIKPAIDKIIQTEKKFLINRDINFGTYATMLSKVLSGCISKYYQQNKNSKIIAITEMFDSLMEKLENSELDVVVATKNNEEEYDSSKIKYTKLGDAQYILVANNDSKLCNKVVSLENLVNKLIYIPRGETNATIDFVEQLKKHGFTDAVKRIDTITMVQIIEKNDCVGLVNIDYVEEELKASKIQKLNTDFKLESSEFGVYIRKDNKFKELDEFIKILKDKFK